MSEFPVELESVFRAVGQALEDRREELNQMDERNHDHGDHMVEVFELASRAALEQEGAPMADAMQRASVLLSARANNASAQVYARGLELLAKHFRQRQIDLQGLLPVVQRHLSEDKTEGENESARAGEVTKALLNALAEWEGVEAEAAGDAGAKSGLDMGYLFTVGMAYLQAKQKGGDRLDVLSETVVSASPLGAVPHRHASGVIAVRALLEAMSA